MPEVKIESREAWLEKAMALTIEKVFKPHEDLIMPPILRIACGICPGSKTLGICTSPEFADDAAVHIWITPKLGNSPEDTIVILATIVHELVHASVHARGYHDVKHGHPFSKDIRTVGLEGKPKSTFAAEGSELYTTLQGIALELGTYPHMPLRGKEPKKRLSKVLTWVSETDPDYTIKINYDLTEAHGAPRDYNNQSMALKDKDKLALIEESLKDLEKIAEEEAEKREEEIAAQ